MSVNGMEKGAPPLFAPPFAPPSSSSLKHSISNSNNIRAPSTPDNNTGSNGAQNGGSNKASHFSTPSDDGEGVHHTNTNDPRRVSATGVQNQHQQQNEPVTPLNADGSILFSNAAIPPEGTPSRFHQHNIPRRPPFGKAVLSLHGIQKSFPVNNGKDIVTALERVDLNDLDGFNQRDAGGRGSDDPKVTNNIQQRDSTIVERKEKVFGPIRKGEFVMIRGPSGGGKTTLLNIIGTIDSPTAGEMVLLGEKITPESTDAFLADLRLRKIGFVFQTFNLIATMSAVENVELPMTLLGDLSERERKRRAKQLLALVGLRNRIDHLPSELSGGEQQRVTIARALANSPELLLLDEPTGDLDTATTIEIMDLLTKLCHLIGTTLIMVTHNPDIECYADRIIFVSDGEFKKQAINLRPQQLDYASYQEYLVAKDQQLTTRVNANGAASADAGARESSAAVAPSKKEASPPPPSSQSTNDDSAQHQHHPHQPPPPQTGPPSITVPNSVPNGSFSTRRESGRAASADSLDDHGVLGNNQAREHEEPLLLLHSSSRPTTGQTVSASDVGYTANSRNVDDDVDTQSDTANDPQL